MMRHVVMSALAAVAVVGTARDLRAENYRYGPRTNRYGCSYEETYPTSSGSAASASGVYSGGRSYYRGSGTYGTYGGYGIGPYVGPVQSTGRYQPGPIGGFSGYIAPRSVYHDSSGYSYYPGQYGWVGGRLEYTPGQYIYNYGRPGVGVFSR